MGIVNSNEWLVVSLPRRKQLTKFPNGGTQNCWSSLFPSRFSFFFVFFLCRRFAFPSRRKERLNGSSIIQRTNQSTFFFFFFFYNRRDDLTVAVCHFLSPFSFFLFFFGCLRRRRRLPPRLECPWHPARSRCIHHWTYCILPPHHPLIVRRRVGLFSSGANRKEKEDAIERRGVCQVEGK